MNDQYLNKFSSEVIETFPAKKEMLSVALVEAYREIQNWRKELPAPTSELTTRMYFIQLLSEKIKMDEILHNEKIISILLDDTGIRKVGDSVDYNGQEWKVIWRKIGKNFGIEMGIKNKDGEIFNWEFFD